MATEASLGGATATPKLKKPRERVIRSKSEKIMMWILFGIFIIYSFTLIYPFFYLLINSFKDNWDIRVSPLSLPEKLLTMNYETVFEQYQIGEMFFNSVTLSVGLTFTSMTLSCMSAYVLAKYRFKGNSFIYTVIIVSATIPTQASLAATYRLMNDTGLTDTYIGMILLQCGAFGGQFLFLHACFKGIPWSYAESAMLDGASNVRVFLTIMVPMIKSSVIMFSIMRFLGFWNAYWMPSLFYAGHPTLATGIAVLSSEAQTTGANAELFAAMIISIVPILIFYGIFQKQLINNTIGGGLKG